MIIDPVFYIFGVVDSRGVCLTSFHRDPDSPEITKALADHRGSTLFRARAKVDAGSMAGPVGGKALGRPRKESRSEFESIIRKGMEAVGIGSYTRLAQIVDVTPAIIQQWCNGTSKPFGKTADKLISVLKLSAEDMAKLSKPKHNGRHAWLLDQATPEELAYMWDGQPVETADGDYEPWGLPSLRSRLASQGVMEPVQAGTPTSRLEQNIERLELNQRNIATQPR